MRRKMIEQDMNNSELTFVEANKEDINEMLNLYKGDRKVSIETDGKYRI